jgi:hypothetical protein
MWLSSLAIAMASGFALLARLAEVYRDWYDNLPNESGR